MKLARTYQLDRVTVNFPAITPGTPSSFRLTLLLLLEIIKKANIEETAHDKTLDEAIDNKTSSKIIDILKDIDKEISKISFSSKKDREKELSLVGKFLKNEGKSELKWDMDKLKDQLENLVTNISELENTLSEMPKLIRKAILSHNELLFQMILCREVDNYLAYISDLFSLIFHTKPEALRSSETVDLKTILHYNNMNELIAFLVEKRVNDLAYRGIRELNDHFFKEHGFRLLNEEDDIKCAVQIIQMRNIIVHNRSIINDRFLKDVPDTTAKAGERLKLKFGELFDFSTFLARSVCDIDVRAAKKFKLPQPISGALSNPWASS